MKLAKSFAAVTVLGLFLMACGGTTSGGVTLGKKIAFLLPEAQTARYESKDLPYFEARIQSLCSNCTVDYQNAHQDASTQLEQAVTELAGGASVLVLDPVDGAAAASIVATAKGRHVPVIAYDRLVLNSPNLDYYVSFDNAAVGPLQANGLITVLQGKTNPNVVMINGDPGDNVSAALKKGVLSILDGKVSVAKTYETPAWNPVTAQTEMADALTALQGKVDAVYAADDGTAAGVAAALKAANVKPLPPITGDGAELTAIQRILVGDQLMTVYRSIRTEAEAAAQLAYDLAYGVAVPFSMTGGKTLDNGSTQVPALLISPVAVTRQTIVSTVLADGFWTRSDICTAVYATACSAAGLI